MEDKKYIDKIIGSLVRSTKIDYEKGIIFFPFSPSPISIHFSLFPSLLTPFYLSTYCKNTYGLTDKEIEYVFNQWREIILGKINNGE